MAAVSLAALLAALLAGRLAGRAISAPILALAGTARAVSERSDFSVRAVPRGRDEVGVLVATFNEMLDGLQRRDAELRRVQAELEQRVEERTELLREAEDANRLKDQFLATLSHELRTPLNAIVGWTTLLMQGNLQPDAAARAVTVIDRNARAQTKLIEDVLDVSRIVSGKLRLNVAAPSTWPTVVKAAADSVGHAATAKRIRLKLLLEAGTAPVSGDPDRLQQVVWNLLSNAIKFTPAGGHGDRARRAGRQQRDARGARRRGRHRARFPAPRVRAVPPGRCLHHARLRRPRPRPVHRAAPRRAARRDGAGGERRAGPRLDLHRRAAR